MVTETTILISYSLAKEKKTLEELLNDDSFVRWIRGYADTTDEEAWESWLHEDADRFLLVQSARKFFNLPFVDAGISEESIARELEKVNSLISKTEAGQRARERRLFARADQHYYFLFAVAAGVALLIGVMTLLWPQNVHRRSFSTYKTVTVPYGNKTILNLTDGSKIIVNANSTFRYHFSPGGDTVNAWLSGEAYFSITHSPNRELLIHTPDGLIKDLGTIFTVNTRDQATRVVLEEGKIRVAVQDTLSHSGKSYNMQPGELAYFAANQPDITVEKVNPIVFTSWIHNKFVFDETLVQSVIKNIEEIYGVQIHTTDQGILKQRISGSIRSYDLDVILKGLSRILNVKVTRKGKQITISSIHK